MYLINVKEENRMIFSEPAGLELKNTFNKVQELFDTLITGIEDKKEDKIAKCEEIEAELDLIVKEVRTNHLNRLRNNKCMPLSGVTFADMILHLERIGDLLYGVSKNFRNM
jgi:phosphate:Na+ symporter